MKLEMICTGEEVLSGQIIDTNAAWVANTLMGHGIEMQQRLTVGDRMEDLVTAFSERSHFADVILVNGGLGPTSDDLSSQAMALALGEELVEHTQWREHLEAWFTQHKRTMPASNLKQCLLPESAILVDNPVGSAPGFRVKFNKAWLFFTPGVPFELKQMVHEQFIPFLQQEFDLSEPTKLHKLLTLGHGESSMADSLEQLTVPEGITVGYRSSAPHVEIKLFARGDAAIMQLPNFATLVKESLGTAVVTEGPANIAEEVHGLLMKSKKTLSIAESCTGGMLASQLIEYPGSSQYLLQGIVSYSNEAKTKNLNVSKNTLNKHGAVSLETAQEMALGVLELSNSDFALATTGIAGPEGGAEDKPVGTVMIALAMKNQVWVQAVLLSNRSRTLVRTMSCAIALDMLRRQLLGEIPIVDYSFIPRTDIKVFENHKSLQEKL